MMANRRKPELSLLAAVLGGAFHGVAGLMLGVWLAVLIRAGGEVASAALFLSLGCFGIFVALLGAAMGLVVRLLGGPTTPGWLPGLLVFLTILLISALFVAMS